MLFIKYKGVIAIITIDTWGGFLGFICFVT